MQHDFPGLLRDKTAAGTLRWRVRVEGKPNKKLPIPVGPGEPGFHEHYHAARAGEAIEVVKPAKPKQGTLDELCDRYLEALEKKISNGKASPLTLKSHRSLLRRACDMKDPEGDRMGSLDAELPKEAFVHIQDEFGGATGAADNCIKALRAAYRWGSERGYPESQIALVKKVHENQGGAEAWSVSDMAKFLRRHGPGTMARLWFFLSLNTLPRIADVGRIGPRHRQSVPGGAILAFQPSKRGSAPVTVPMLRQLMDELRLHPEGTTFLATERGRPFGSPEAMRNRVQKWTEQAGLPTGRTQHGIRKNAATLLGEAGATQYEIMSLMAHTEAKTSEIYTKRVERAALAATAVSRLAAIDFSKLDHAEKIVAHNLPQVPDLFDHIK